jgi:aspartate aminotransferase
MVSLWSFSKSHAMSGLRVGYAVTTSAELRDRFPKVLRCSINGVNSARPVGRHRPRSRARATTSTHAGEYAGAPRRDARRRSPGLDGVRPFVPRGASTCGASSTRRSTRARRARRRRALVAASADAGVGSAPGDAFGESCRDAIRFAYSCGTEMVRDGAPALRALLTGERALPGVAARGAPRGAAA